MAGIGFELKKIFKERSVFNLLKGTFYSTFTVIGPMLIVIICYAVLLLIMGFQNIDYSQKDFLTSVILYCFIFSLILTSPLSAVISRYIADKIFEEKTEDVLPCYYSGLLINTAIGTAFGVPFAIKTIQGGSDYLPILFAYCLYMALIFVFYNMTFISALKEYKSIALAFLSGMGITLVLSYSLFNFFGISFINSMLSGMACGFLATAFILFALIRGFFVNNSGNYHDFLPYIWKYKILFLTNLLYILGIYVHNFVFWNVPSLAIVVSGTMRSAPVYDTASFLAMMTNVSCTVIFTVRAEINFHERYQTYCQQILGGIGKDISIAKNNMFTVLVKEMLYIVQIQAIISVIVFLTLISLASFFGLGGLIMAIYPALAAGYFVIYIMYCMIIFLYYFNDYLGAFLASLAFCVITFAAALIAVNLNKSLYGIAPFAGAFAGWAVAFFRIKYTEHNLDRSIFCKGELLKKMYVKNKKNQASPLDNVISMKKIENQK